MRAHWVSMSMCRFGNCFIRAFGRICSLSGRIRLAVLSLSRCQRSEVRGATGYSGLNYAANQLLNQLALIQTPESETSDFTLQSKLHTHPRLSIAPILTVLTTCKSTSPPTERRYHLIQPSKGTHTTTMSHYIGKVHHRNHPFTLYPHLTQSTDPPSLFPLLAPPKRLLRPPAPRPPRLLHSHHPNGKTQTHLRPVDRLRRLRRLHQLRQHPRDGEEIHAEEVL